jgi:autotransporter-associated beta strand protein
LLDGSFAALVFAQNAQGGFGLDNANTINTNGPGGLLFLNKVKATQLNVNSGTVQFGNGSAVTAATTPELQATNVAIASGAQLIFNRAEAHTNTSVFTGAGSLTQAGAGTLTLTGDSSAFAGSTTVNAARTLAIGTNGNFGAAGSTLNLASATASVGFTNASGTSTIGSTISGAGTLSQSGAGTGVLLVTAGPPGSGAELVFTDGATPPTAKVWAGGDIVTGAATVILAMGSARRAADDMHAYLSEGDQDRIVKAVLESVPSSVG